MNWLRLKPLYFGSSLVLVAISLFSLLTWGLRLGIDFRGGTIVEYAVGGDVLPDSIREAAEGVGIEVTSVQQSDSSYILRSPLIEEEKRQSLPEAIEEIAGGETFELRFERVGPSIGPELVRKTTYALIIASVGILIWVAIQFRSLKYGVSAIFAMLHDTFILIGAFSLLGHFFGAEVDFLFVTALLTTLSFSVHDTIVVFDRIREIGKSEGGGFYDTANRALSETMVRSLNNSFTIIFMLVALVLLGGTTIKWFAVALLVGTILGTYSSPFVATPLLVTWDSLVTKKKP